MPGVCPLASLQLRAVARWWIRAYREHGIPSRHRVDPLALKSALPCLWLLEYEPQADRFRYRLAGEAVNETFGFSLRGRYLEDIIEAHMLRTVRARLLHTLTTPGAVHAINRVHARGGRFREGERLILPLAETGAQATHVLGATDYFAVGRQDSPQPSREYRQDTFLELADVLAWRDALEDDGLAAGPAGR